MPQLGVQSLAALRMEGLWEEEADPRFFPAQEKLRYLQLQLLDETPRRQEVEMQALELKLEAGLSRSGLQGSPEEAARLRGMAPSGCGSEPRAGEAPPLSQQELQKVSTGLEELRWAGPRGLRWAGPRRRPYSRGQLRPSGEARRLK